MRNLAILTLLICGFVAASWQLGFGDSLAAEPGELERLQAKYLDLVAKQVTTYSEDQLEELIGNIEASKLLRKEKKGRAVSNPVVHFEIGCRDSEKTQKFFSELFNWQIQAAGSAAMISTGSEEGIAGHITALGHEPHNYVTVYVQVNDIQAHLDKAKRLGGKMVVPPTEVPGMGEFAWFSDLDGNTVGLWKSVKQR